jgi:arabinose-5-phosphate isomerase
MKKKNSQFDFTEDIMEVLDIEAQAILSIKNKIRGSINLALNMILEQSGRVIVTGIGKSGIVGRKINATLASTGTPSLFLHAAEGLHGDLGMVTESDVVLALSNSGETEELLQLIPSIQRIGAKIISIVKNPLSTLAKKSDITLCIGEIEEACPLYLAPTASTTAMLALGDAIAIALLKAREFKSEQYAVFHPAGTLGKRLLLTAGHIVTSIGRNPRINMDTTFMDAIFVMTKNCIGATNVVDEHGTLVGILTDGDIRRMITANHTILPTSVRGHYNIQPITINESTLAIDTLHKMKEKKLAVIPVLDEESKKPLGIIHIHDLHTLGI